MRAMDKRYSNDFEIFYKIYIPPKTSNKACASKAYQKIWYDLPDQPLLLACVEAYNHWLAQHKGHFKCHPATWLKNRGWENWIEEGAAMIKKQSKTPDAVLADSERRKIPPSRPLAWWGLPRALWKPEWRESEVPRGEKVRDPETGLFRPAAPGV